MLIKELKEFLIDFISTKIPVNEKEFSKKLDVLINEIFPTPRAITNLKRILESDYYLSIYLEDLDYLFQYLEIIIKISAFSNYLTDVMVRNPEFLTRFLSSGEFHKDFNYDDFSDELEKQISIYKSFEKKFDAIRRFKRLHLLRIGIRDILNLCEIEQTMLEYSFLTKAILNKVFVLSIEIQKINSSLKNIPDYILISLGKLGGLELNFSSDVDLICVYDNPDESNSSEVLEFYDKVAKDFIRVCSDTKDGSSLYRIDFRLRPDGKYSPLARSISYYQIYYETYGRDWERQMLLKMNFVSGNKILFDKFYKSLQNFVFPRSFIVPPQIFIQRFRKIYLDNLNDSNQTNNMNLKHFKGGIRDLEFSVQALQLLNGGRFNELRSSNTINTIRKLVDFNLIENQTGENLINAYKFLRRIENFIQLMDDRQLHSLPQDQDRFQNLIKYCGIKNATEFNRKLKFVRKTITDFSNKVFETNSIKPNKKLFEKLNVKDEESFKEKYQQLLSLITERSADQVISFENNLIDKFQSNLVKNIRRCENPEKVINYFYRLISNLHSSFQIIEILKNQKLLKTLVEIFDNADYLSQILISDKNIIDVFFSGRIFNQPSLENFNYTENEIRLFISHLMFNLFFGNLTVLEVGQLISEFLENLIHGLVQDNINKSKIDKNDFALVASGSFGTREMHFKSDLDLLFIFSDDVDQIYAEKFSVKLLSKIREIFKIFDFFQADSKLRPEGSVSKLSWTIEEFQKYVLNRMRVWEFQSYTKSRLIFGNQKIFDELIKLIKSRILMMDKNFIASEIKRNRINIKSQKVAVSGKEIDLKNGNGGLMDLQFLVQYEILINGFNQNLIGNNFFELTTKLSKSESNLRSNYKILSSNYLKLFKMILIQQVLTGRRSFVLDKSFNSKFIRKAFRIDKSTSIFDYFNRILKENFEIIQKTNPEIF